MPNKRQQVYDKKLKIDSPERRTERGILENRQYTGCAVNFMTTTVSYKVHKIIYNPEEKQQIIPNMQEPIISEEQWLQVQEIRYRRLMREYESEQYDLEPQVEKSKKDLETFDQRSVDLRLLLKTVREQTDVKELTPALVNSLIERIGVHNNDKYDGHCHVKVDIYFTVVGMMSIPDEKEIQAMMEEMKNNPKTLKYVS